MREFDEYIVHGEPGQKEKADAWQPAIGLQNVDGLKSRFNCYALSIDNSHLTSVIN